MAIPSLYSAITGPGTFAQRTKIAENPVPKFQNPGQNREGIVVV